MNRDDIIRMAREAGFADGVVDIVGFEGFANFAALVAAHEREECLKLVDEQIHNMTVLDSYPEQSGAIYQAIINIRARGEK
jgi:hypothetical protein